MDFKEQAKYDKEQSEIIKAKALAQDLEEKKAKAKVVVAEAMKNKGAGFHSYRTTSRCGLLPELEIVEFLNGIEEPIKSWKTDSLSSSIMVVVYEI